MPSSSTWPCPRCAPPASPCRSSSITSWATCPRPSSSARSRTGREACRRRCCSPSWPWPCRGRSTWPACARWGATRRACRRRWPRGRRDMRRALIPLVEALFRVLFTYDCRGEENVPARGPAVIAANHPSYLDPLLLSLQVRRPIYFMAWDALFRVPLLGALMRAFGAFPVDIRRGRGREAYEKARALVMAGEVVGLFPEGQRSRAGRMEPRLREGAARLAWETGAVLVAAVLLAGTRTDLAWAAPPAYLAYLALDHRLVPQSRLAKWVRNSSPVVFLALVGPAVLGALGAPPVRAGAALVAVLAGALF